MTTDELLGLQQEENTVISTAELLSDNNKEETLSAPSFRAFKKGIQPLNFIDSVGDLFMSPVNVGRDVVNDMINTDEPFLDSLKFNFNKNVSQKIRDDLGFFDDQQNKGAFFQPDFVKRNGKTYQTGNKNFNDFTKDELEYLKQQFEDTDGEHEFYEIEKPSQGFYKPGFTKKSVQERWGKDSDFINWEIKDRTKSNDAKTLERLFHGSSRALEKRVFDYGDKNNNAGLSSSYTEIQRMGLTRAEQINENNKFKQVAAEIKAKEKLKKFNVFGDDIKTMSNPDLIKALHAKNAEQGGVISPHGAIEETQLARLPQYQKLGKILNGAGLIDIPDDSSPEQFGQAMNEAMSRVNWNMADLFKTVADLSNKPELAGALADAIEMYSTTDTSVQQVIRGTGRAITDPFNWMTGGAGATIKNTVAKEASQKKLLSTLRGYASKGIRSNVGKGIMAGAGWGGAYDSGIQAIGLEGNTKKAWNYYQTLKSVGAGAVLGGTLSKVISLGAKGEAPTINAEELKRNHENINQKFMRSINPNEKKALKEQRDKIGKTLQKLNNIKRIKDDVTRKIEEEELTAMAINDWTNLGYLKQYHETSKLDTDKNINTKTEKEDIPEPLEKKEVKGQSEVTTTTKAGTEQDSAKVKARKKNIENKTFEVENPKQERVAGEHEELPNQKDTKTQKRKMKVTYEFDDVGRLYVKEQNLLSHQGTSDQKAALVPVEDLQIKETKDATAEIESRMEFYDENKEMQKRYGQNQAKIKKQVHGKSKSREMANRKQFELDQIDELISRKDVPDNIKAELKTLRYSIKEKKITDYKYSREQKIADEQRALDKYNIPDDDVKTRTDNTIELTRDYEEFVQAKKDSLETTSPVTEFYDGLPQEKKTIVDNQTVEAVTRKMKEYRNDAVKAHELLEKKVLLKTGEKWNGQLTPEIRKQFQKEAEAIYAYKDRKADLADFKSKKIKIGEVRYREQRRIQEKQSRKDESTFDSKEELDRYANQAIKEFEEIGIKVTPNVKLNKSPIDKLKQDLKDLVNEPVSIANDKKAKDIKKKLSFLEQKERSDKTRNEKSKPNEEYKEKRENAERKNSLSHREKLTANVETYKRNKKSGLPEAKRHPNQRDGKMGEQRMSQTQRDRYEWVEKNVITQKEYLDTYAPTGKDGKGVIKEDLKEAKKNAKEIIDIKIYEYHQRQLGIKKGSRVHGLPANIKFHANVVDASNSAAQMMAVLMGSENIAKLAKLYNLPKGAETDVREIIGLAMQDILGYKPKVMDKGKERSWKDLVKYVFMTDQYGQMKPGSVKDLMSYNKMSRAEAEKFYDAYEKAFDGISPEMKQLKDSIYDLMNTEKFNKTIEYTMPDGFVVKFNIEKMEKGTIKVKGAEQDIVIKTGGLDEVSRALMPRIIHSVDAYAMRYLNEKGFHGVHDASFVPKGKEKVDVDKAYTEIMSLINEGDLLHSIMGQIGYKGESIKKNLKTPALESKNIAESTKKLGDEHKITEPESSKARTKDLGKTLTSEEVMRDWMASSNYREIPTNQIQDAMVYQSSFNNEFMSKARKSDDVYERQLALAMQDSKYNKSLEVKAPDGVNQKMWNETQRKIFNEFRAKLEYNPNFRRFGLMKGERVHFDINGNIIGKRNKTISELINTERRIGRQLHKQTIARLSKNQIKDLNSVGKTYETIASKVKRWNEQKTLTQVEEIAIRIVREAETQIAKKGWFKSLTDGVKESEYYAYFERQIGETDRAKEFNSLHSIQQHGGEVVARQKKKMKKHLEKIIPESERENVTKSLLFTDAEAISDINGRIMSRDTANLFMERFSDILNHEDKVLGNVSEAIKQGAKAIGQPEHQIGFFHDSAIGIAQNYGLPPSSIEVIDKAMSIMAMKEKDWNFIAKFENEDWFKEIINIRKIDKQRSKKLFEDNPQSMVKGWIAEVYEGGKMLSTDEPFNKTSKPKVQHDTTAGDEAGAIPIDIEKQTTGTKIDDMEATMGENGEMISADLPKIEMNKANFEEALLKRRKITGKKDRVLGDKKLRDDLGRTYDATTILSETTGSIEAKETRRSVVNKIVTRSSEFGNIFSRVEKDGMIKVSDDILARMPDELKKVVKYVDKGLQRQILGVKKATLSSEKSNRLLRVTDILWLDLVKRKKQDVVLKNPASHINALVINQTIGASLGMTPRKMLEYQLEALTEMTKNDKLFEQLAIAKANGKDTTAIQRQLNNSLLFRMEKAGLATNVIEGVEGSGGILANAMSDISAGKLDKATNMIMLNQNSASGRLTTNSFSMIDTSGRYQLAKHFMDNGKTLEQAVLEANGLLGDMNQIAPVLIDSLDRYGVAPFLKWFSQSSPMLMKKMKTNPKGIITVAVGIYALGAISDQREGKYDKDNFGGLNTSSWSQVESLIDFTAMQFTKKKDMEISVENAEKDNNWGMLALRELGPYILPSLYKKPAEVWGYDKDGWGMDDTKKALKKLTLPNRTKDYGKFDARGETQTFVEDNILND